MEIHKRGQKKNQYNTVWFGLLCGLLVPAVIVLLFWYVKFYPTISLGKFFTEQFQPDVIMKIVSICALPDLLVFYLFNRKEWYSASRGIIGSIIILILITLMIKL